MDEELVDESVGNTLKPIITRARANPSRIHDIRTAARAYREHALETLADVMDTGRDAARVAAASVILAYSDGKPGEGRGENGDVQQSSAIDTSRLSPEQLKTLLDLMLIARGDK
jgi:hypothetical protein